MRVLFVGHTYIVSVNRQKLREIAKLDGVELFAVVPLEWPHYLRKYMAELDESELYAIYPTKTVFHGNETRYFYFPNITMYMHKVKPNIIHVEQGAGALVYTQAILMKKIFAPRAKCLFFTWRNRPYKIKRPWWWLVEKFNLANSDYAIVGNQDAKDILRQRGFKKPIRVLPQLGIDPDVYKKFHFTKLRKELGLNGFTIGFVGRFVRAKGILTLVKAASRIKKNYSILLVGQGELKPEIIKLATELGIIDRVRFVDAVPHDEVPLYLNCMDVLLLPSLTTPTYAPSFKEQFGHVLIEAMACEVPVIGSSSAEIPSVIGDAGFIFREGDAEDLFHKLQLIMQNKALRQSLAKKGRERVLSKFTHKIIAEETYKVYQELLNS